MLTYFAIETVLPHGGASTTFRNTAEDAAKAVAADREYYLGPDMYPSIVQSVEERCAACNGEGVTHHKRGKRVVRRFTRKCEVCCGNPVVTPANPVTISR